MRKFAQPNHPVNFVRIKSSTKSPPLPGRGTHWVKFCSLLKRFDLRVPLLWRGAAEGGGVVSVCSARRSDLRVPLLWRGAAEGGGVVIVLDGCFLTLLQYS